MFKGDQLNRLITSIKRDPLLPGGTGTPVNLGLEALERLLPHRAPMLLVDAIDTVSIETSAVRGSRTLRTNDLGFAGHFPADPIYPGMLVVEAMGQLGLTLVHFAGEQSTDVPPGLTPKRVRATRVHHASFLVPFRPGDTMTLHAMVVDLGMTMVAACQAWKGEDLGAFAIAEVYIDE